MTINFQYYHSPCGDLVLGADGDELFLCDWSGRPCAERNKRRLTRLVGAEFKEDSSPALDRAESELDEYFAGLRTSFDIPLHPVGTPFQQSVWAALKEIPYGETRTYMEIARRVGNLRGIRAVAQAIGANSLSIFIPCHRVIGADNSLTGFAGGLKAKSRLLAQENTREDSLSLETVQDLAGKI